MQAFLNSLPDWAGTVPQWGLFAAVLIAIIQTVPKLRQQTMDKEITDMERYRLEVVGLRDELKTCEEQCAKDLRDLQEELWGMRKQNIAEQISLINIILNSVDAPELKAMLKVLENVRSTLSARGLAETVVNRNGAAKPAK